MLRDLGTVGRLAMTQRWMQACIMAPGTAEEAVSSREAQREVPARRAPEMIRPSRTLAPLERLDIYRGMYEARLREALAVDYPGLVHFLGEEIFSELVELYVRENPSRSYTLNRLGDRFPEFLERVEGLPRPLLAGDLARLELAATHVFDEEESASADGSAVKRIPKAAWEHIRLRPIRALRLLALQHPAHLYLEAIRREKKPPLIRRQKTWLIVHRRDYALLYLSLSRPAFSIFRGLAEGLPLGEAMEAAFEAGGASEKEVFAWFREWFSERLFQQMEVGSG